MRSRLLLVFATAILAAVVVAGTGFAERGPSQSADSEHSVNPLSQYGFTDLQDSECVVGFDESGEPIIGEPSDCEVDHAALDALDEPESPDDGESATGDEEAVDEGEEPDEPVEPVEPERPGKGEFNNPKRSEKKSNGTFEKEPDEPKRKENGEPTDSNPGLTVADFGPIPVGVPNFVIDSFSIPPFLLPIYQACGTQYGIPWQILASINRIETAFGTNLSVSSAGAQGWMQFMPGTWKAYGVDANDDGVKDPYNPVDAICAAARYLDASGGTGDLRRAIFAYNHADWYVDEVLLYAGQYGKLPTDLISSLTGLTEGARFPVAANARYADDISEREMAAASESREEGEHDGSNVAQVIADSPTRRGINIFSRKGAPVIAVNDGVIRKIGKSKKLGKFVVLEDAYGNRFTYAGLGKLAEVHPVGKRKSADADLVAGHREEPNDDPIEVAGQGARNTNLELEAEARRIGAVERAEEIAAEEAALESAQQERRRLYALPERDNNLDIASGKGQLDLIMSNRFPGYERFKSKGSNVLKFNPKTMSLRPLRKGSRVVAGTVLGEIGKTNAEVAPHLNFAIKPAGRGAPKIDPKPILDGWKLLEATEIYRANGKNPFAGSGATVGQILLMSKEQLQRRVLSNPKIEIYDCGRSDIKSGQTDRRILALLEYLTARGFRLTITSLTCGHSYYSKSGNISHHTIGSAVDIAAINGQVINAGTQGAGSLTHAVLGEIMRLQGAMRPDQLISLLALGGPSFAMADHDDHIHVGYRPAGGLDSANRQTEILKPGQWRRLSKRLGEIQNPEVRPTKKKNRKSD